MSTEAQKKYWREYSRMKRRKKKSEEKRLKLNERRAQHA
jgi:hypothetical protein